MVFRSTRRPRGAHAHFSKQRPVQRGGRSGGWTSRINRLTRTSLHVESLESRALLTATSLADVPIHLPEQFQLFNPSGYLTGPSNQTPIQVAEDYLRANTDALGLLPADLNNYFVTTNYVTQSTGATTLTFQQSLNGLPVANANFNITVAADGRLLSVAGGFVQGLSGQSHPGPVASLTAPAAISSVATTLEINLDDPPKLVGNLPNGVESYRADGLSLDDIPATMRYLAGPNNTVELVWNMTVRTPDSSHWYSLDVDAGSGEVLHAVDFVSHANYEVFAAPNRSPLDSDRTIETDPHIIAPSPSLVPSPFGWHDTNGADGAEFTITNGNNVNAYADRDADNQPDAGSQPDGGPALDFTGALVPIDFNSEPDTYTAAAVTNLFYWNNISHDVHYLYGFDEAARNFQVNNYGRGGLGNDAVNAEAQDGLGFNNANFATPPDGIAPRMQMFEFNLTTPNRDGDFDAEIIIHEYGHGVSNRLTGNGFGLGALQSRGMGEGWSDWWSLMFTQKSADETTNGRGVGNYALGLPSTGPGVRDFRYDFDIGNLNLETFLHYGVGPGQSVQFHSAGTRWAAALWDITHQFTQKYGYESNIYNSTSDAGNIRALHLIMNALKIQPLNPTFIQARDAVLSADMLLYGGANQFEIWTAFARRGLGVDASTPNSESVLLTTSFDIPEGLLPIISMGPDVAQLEGNSGTTNVVFSVSLASNQNNQLVTVAYTTLDGTAIAGEDYIAQSGTVTFQPDGSLSRSITVQVLGDLNVEGNETFLVQLGAASNGVVGRAEATGTILNDDVDLSINDLTVVEGNFGTTLAAISVSATGAVNQQITVNFATSSGTAVGGTDYVPTAGIVTMTPGSPTGTILVPIVNDTFNEANESFFVLLSSASNANIVRGVGTVTIIDNDPLPAFYVNDAYVSTISADFVGAMFTIGIDNRSGRDVSIHYTTVDHTAKAGESYVAQSGDLTFVPGVSTIQVTVPVLGSAVYEPNEQFFLDLSSPSHATIADGRGMGTIIFGTPPPQQYIVDDGDPGFSTNNGWTSLTNLLAYQLDYMYHAAGNGSAAANWNFNGLANGTYEVFTRWSHFSNRATNAPYTILDGQTPLATVLVNQQAAPVGDHVAGITWQSLGSYTITNGILNVRLTDAANGFVTADAVRIVSAGSITQAPEIDVAGLEHSIGAGDTTPSIADGTNFGETLITTDGAVHKLTITNTGNADLVLTGSPAVQLSGTNPGDFVVVSQPSGTVVPGGSTTFDVMFHPTATGPRQAVVSIANNDGNEGLYQFVIGGTGSATVPGASPLQNTALPVDVNADSLVTPRDALIVINELLRSTVSQASVVPAAATASSATYFPDVDGNGVISPRDVLMVINYLLVPPTAQPVAAPAAAPAVQAFVVDEAIGEVVEPEPALVASASTPLASTATKTAVPAGENELLVASSVEAAFAADDSDEAEDEFAFYLD